ncbi:DUF4352 domain-containing protein [Weissella viridescens]|mgnify:CR=1 FL=1|uniref:DUF4352 domain-containing protein n=1 Tax=Weissella viridescens TaxID=1629 RepID=UPI00092F8FB8|nr:DUF4352 domain-containing protein [Weissella viridescens]
MAKKITDENGNTYVQKKPFYKRIWFWLLAVVVLFFIVGALGSSDDEPKKTSESSTSSTSKKSDASDIDGKTYKVGDTVEYKGVEFKVNSFQFKADDPDASMLKDGNQFAVANITITNKSDETISYNPYDFKLDNAGNLTDLDEIDIDNDNTLDSGDLKPGATVTGDLIGQGKPEDQLKLNYNGNMFTTDESFSVNLNN